MASFDETNKVLSYFLTGLAYLIAIPFFYIVIFKSPPSMRVYKNTILNLAVWHCITLGCYAALLQPVYATLPNKSCARFAGLVSYFGREVNIAMVFFTAICVENVAAAIIICFFYRYEQLRFTANAVSFMETHKGLLTCASFQLIISLCAAGLAYAILAMAEIFEHEGAFLFCCPYEKYHFAKVLAVFVGFAFVAQSAVVMAFVLVIIRRLLSVRTMMTKGTYRLHRLLTINLITLTALPITFDVIPFCVFAYMVYIKADSLYFWVPFVGHTPCGDIILSFVITLYFVTPYRKAIKKILRKRKVSDVVFVVTTVYNKSL
ncbi:hypothetical protein QR680_015251 [Steinernema hermaphroditum]|uniref:Uncharacterized protein n=1 Tax=Steinernema hermaphroditum TaxID=289476 RepID=A0AA39H9N7_9BILA|nr:hypothetical protein QR680_015251 [Steinernema hermaphroditum]